MGHARTKDVSSTRVLALSLVLMVSAAVSLTGCGLGQTGVQFPSYEISYRWGCLFGDGLPKRVLSWEDIDMPYYPHLKLIEGFTLRRAIYQLNGGDAQGYLVAIYQASGTGFKVEPLNGIQGDFLFGPIKSPQQALEYVELMIHETPMNTYDREHVYINNPDEFQQAMHKLDENAESFKDSKVESIKTPPTNVTRVTVQGDDKYLVELVYRCELYNQRIEYAACVVGSDGSLKLGERYVFIEGPPGAML